MQYQGMKACFHAFIPPSNSDNVTQHHRPSMEARASNTKAWKHESILLYFYSTYITQCHIDSTSVAYKQSEEEDI